MMVEKLTIFEAYLGGLKARGEGLPTRDSEMKPNFRAISAASGVGYKYLCTRPFKQMITLAVKEIGLTPPEATREVRRQRLFEKNYALLGGYLEWLGGSGHRLPEDPRRKGQIFFRQVEIEAGLSPDALTLKYVKSNDAPTARLNKMVTGASSRLGIEVRILPQFPGQCVSPLTYELLRDRGTEARAVELESKPRARQQLYNTRTALKRFLKLLKLKMTDQVGNELAANFEASLANVTGKIESPSSRKKLQTEIWWWHDLYQKITKELILDADFPRTFAHLVDRCGLPFSALSGFVGVSNSTLIAWYHGTSTPGGDCLDALSRFERVFKLPAGALINKLPAANRKPRFRLKQLPQSLRENPRLAEKVTKHLPDDFLSRPPEAREEIVESIRAEVLGEGSPRRLGIVELQKLPYRLKEWPRQLADEFADLAALKLGDRAPLGMRRNGRWKPASTDKHERDLAFLFGALRLERGADDLRLRGLGIPDSHLSMALIACPLLIDWYVRFRGETRTQYTSYLIGLLHFCTSLLMPVTGWIRQRPELASRLRPVSYGGVDFVPGDLIARARADWGGVCDDAISYYRFLEDDVAPLIAVARDPFRPIVPILEMEDPLDAFEMLFKGMESALPDPHTQPVRYHTGIRDRAMMLLVLATGLRRNTVAQLDYTVDGRGHLTRGDGGYTLEVPRALFKVENSAYFGPPNAREDYRADLPDVFGLEELLEEYLNVSRPFLLKNNGAGPGERALFVTSKKCGSIRLSPRLITVIYTQRTATHLTWNRWRGTGIPGAGAQGPHTARHVRATIAFLETGSWEVAGDAIQITREIAFKYYARFPPRDRNKRATGAVFGKRIEKERARKRKGHVVSPERKIVDNG